MAKARVGILLVVATVVFLGVVGGIVALFATGTDAPSKLRVGDLLAGGAFLLAALAAVVATLAYRVTILKPILKADVRFGHGVPALTLFVDPPKPDAVGPRYRTISPFIQCDVHIHLHNHGQVSARNPAVKFRVDGMMLPPHDQEGWVLGDHFHGRGGYGWAQWDGGADYSIHPQWGRDLPILKLYGVTISPDVEPAIVLELVADGFSETTKLPVTFKENPQYSSTEPSATSKPASGS